jgi:hypothetical protein
VEKENMTKFEEHLETILLNYRNQYMDLSQSLSAIKDLIDKEGLAEKEIMPMTTNHRLGIRTLDWVRGFNLSLKDSRARMGITKGEK